MTSLNCCKLSKWFYYADTKHIVFAISFFNFYELFPDFLYANDIWNQINNLFGVKIFNPSFTSLSPSSGGISEISINPSVPSLFS